MSETPNVKLRNELGGIQLEEGPNADNLAIALATYFDIHMDRPDPDPDTGDLGWGDWVIEKTNDALDKIVTELNLANR